MPAAERRRRASRLLDEVGIGAERRLQLRKFSKGMLQRVGIAQALVNDPEVVFFDEPMSGLDPLGRREIRQLILRLRERGCTVFFSSHVLADAEALCSRVAIVARGRLVASGALSEILAFKVHGWELVVSDLTPAALECARTSGRVTKAVPLGEDRYALDLPLSAAPEQLLGELTAAGRPARVADAAARNARGLLRPPGGRGEERPGAGMSALRTIATVAVSVFRESVRDKVLYNLVAFAVLLMAASYLLGQLTAGQDIKIIKDLGLAAIATFGLMIAVFIGIGLVWKEVERRSIYSLLTKPLSRAEFILGKYCGLVLTLVVNLVVMIVAFYAVLAYMGASVSPEVRASWAAPATDPGDAAGDRAHPRRADARHRHRALLLDLLEPVPLGRPDARALGHRPLQRRPPELRVGRRLARRGLAGARPLLRAAQLLGLRHQARRSCTRSRCRRPISRRPRSTAPSTSRCCSWRRWRCFSRRDFK